MTVTATSAIEECLRPAAHAWGDARSPSVLHQPAGVGPGHDECWTEAEGERTGDAQPRHNRHNPAVHREMHPVRNIAAEGLGDELNTEPGEPNPQRASHERQHDAFSHELPHDAPSSCADRCADGDLTAAARRTGKQQVGDIRAGDEQDEHGRCESRQGWLLLSETSDLLQAESHHDRLDPVTRVAGGATNIICRFGGLRPEARSPAHDWPPIHKRDVQRRGQATAATACPPRPQAPCKLARRVSNTRLTLIATAATALRLTHRPDKVSSGSRGDRRTSTTRSHQSPAVSRCRRAAVPRRRRDARRAIDRPAACVSCSTAGFTKSSPAVSSSSHSSAIPASA